MTRKRTEPSPPESIPEPHRTRNPRGYLIGWFNSALGPGNQALAKDLADKHLAKMVKVSQDAREGERTPRRRKKARRRAKPNGTR